MSKFKRWLRNWLEDRNKLNTVEMCLPSERRLDSDRGINFTVYKASGGTIIETRIYDRIKDRHLNSLHVITDDKDLGSEINKIITMEALKF